MKNVAILLAAVLMPLAAQEIKMPASLDKLAAKADETVDVTLDGTLLKLVCHQEDPGRTGEHHRSQL